MRIIRGVIRGQAVLLLVLVSAVFAQQPAYAPASPGASPRIAELRKQIESGDPGAMKQFWNEVNQRGAPLIEPIPGDPNNSLVTFVWHGNAQTRNVVIFDGVAGFDAKDRMARLDNSDVWFKTYKVRNDARFAYNLSPNDSLESINDIKSGSDAMQNRLATLQIDPLNPHRCPATFGPHAAESSFVELPDAPPLIWNAPSPASTQGKVETAAIHSDILKTAKKLWIYTPRGFSESGDRYPLLIMFDGDRNVMWMPRILDNLIAQKKIPPMVAVLIDDSDPATRGIELPCDPPFADFLAKELVPWSRQNYRVTRDAAQTIVAGSSYGGLAAVFAALRYPRIFGNVISLSGSFWWKPKDATEPEWLTKQVAASPALPIRFYLEVGLMESYAGQIDSNRRMRDVLQEKGYLAGYSEYDGGHAFLNWSGGMANGLLSLVSPGSTQNLKMR
ncbi:MAG: enterochelin esterase [Candidatus Acidiferrales bacterium]